MNEFVCFCCGVSGPAALFAKDKQKVAGVSSYCIKCKRVKRNESAARHREHNRARSSRWYRENAAHVAALAARPDAKVRKAAYMREWRRKNPDYYTEYNPRYAPRRREVQRRWVPSLNAKIARTLRTRLRSALKNQQKTGSAVRDLGCTVSDLVAHLESLFQPGMSWENWGVSGWHIDHIRPLVSFELTDPEQLKQAVHYTNLQPLWQSENQSKDARARKTKPVALAVVDSVP